MRRFIILMFFVGLLNMGSFAQLQLYSPVATAKTGAITATAYNWEAIGINPANLGWDNNQWLSISLADVGFCGESNGLTYGTLIHSVYAPNVNSKESNWEQVLGANNGLIAFGDINWAAVSFRIPKLPGCFAVNLRDRIYGTGFVNSEGAQIYTGSNSPITDYADLMGSLQGGRIHYSHYRELNFDYGVKILSFKGSDDDASSEQSYSFAADDKISNGIYIGGGIKFLAGLADINGYVDNDGLVATYTLTKNYPNISPVFPSSTGSGLAYDLGFSGSYGLWKFGLSLTDIGSITWKNASTTTVSTPSGIFGNVGDFMGGLKSGTLVESTQPAPDYTNDLPAKMRIGASYKLSKHFWLSSDFVMNLNNVPENLAGPYFAVGCQITTWKFLRISTGLAVTEGYGAAMPLGLTFSVNRRVEFYLGTVDIAGSLHLFNDYNLSAAVCLVTINI